MKGSTIWVIAAFLLRFASPALGQSAFTYQGRLSEDGVPVTGRYDAVFRLFAAPE